VSGQLHPVAANILNK